MDRIFVTGDTHGDVDYHKLSQKKWPIGRHLEKSDFLIILGDCGILWKDEEDGVERYLKKFYNSKRFTTLFLDGNHENHNRLDKLESKDFFGGKVGVVSDSIFHLKRGEVYKIGNKKILVVGGAMSHDKYRRKENVSWWSREVLSNEEYQKVLASLEENQYSFDYILTHTMPKSVAFLMGNNWKDKANKCPVSAFLDNLTRGVQFTDWFSGHGHENRDCGKFHSLYEKIVEIT
jgi:predicted phosphodiesterase